MRLLISLGGNALLRRGDAVTADNQRESAAHAAMWLASVVRSHEVVITHGNGPQLGLLALQSFSYVGEPSRLDFLGAEAGGMIGYLLERELRNTLGRDHPFSTLLTQVIVNPQDPAFAKPTKSIGPFYERTHAHQLRQVRGWEFAEFDGRFRRLVAAPRPLTLLETRNVEILLQAGSTVIASGPVPVASLPSGGFHGVEALPDKDACAALLARELSADAFIMLTDVLAAAVNFGKPEQRQIRHATTAMLRAIEFDQATMGPKIEAGCGFVDATGKWAAIGALSDVSRILCGEAGTRIVGSLLGKMDFWDN